MDEAKSSGEPVPIARQGHAESSHALIDYRFPLRADVDVLLQLPRDLKISEAKRLGAFIKALAIDASPSGRSPASEWPAGYFDETYGSFRDAPLERDEQGEYETRAELE